MKFPNSKVADIAIISLLMLLCFADASAQNTLKTTAQSVFTVLYEVIGVIGAIALLIFAVNIKFHFLPNPMKHFFFFFFAIFWAFSLFAVVVFLKIAFGS